MFNDKVAVMKYFDPKNAQPNIWRMRNLANTFFFIEPKVAFGKDPMYIQQACFSY